MADSVHRHAMMGNLTLDLADCEVEVVLSGLQKPNLMLVTKVRILSIRPSEAPDILVEGDEHQIEFIDRGKTKGRKFKESVRATIPTYADGTVELTDDEWSMVDHNLCGQRKRARPSQLCQRNLFDGVLRKLGTFEPWQRSTYKVRDW